MDEWTWALRAEDGMRNEQKADRLNLLAKRHVW